MDETDVLKPKGMFEGVEAPRMVPVFGCNVCRLKFMLESMLFEHLEESGHGRSWLKRYRD